DIVAEVVSRRGLLRAGTAGALVAGALAAGVVPATPAMADPGRHGRGSKGGRGRSRLTFTAVPPGTDDRVTVPEGYDSAVVVRWGDPVLPDAPAFDFDNQTAEAQAKQFGYNCDFVAFFP